MVEEQIGSLHVRLVGNATAESNGAAGSDGLLVVLLHGYGAPGHDLVPFANHVSAPESTGFVFPEAPLSLSSLGPGARAWWPVDIPHLQAEYLAGRAEALWRFEPPDLPKAREKVLAVLEELRRRSPGSRLVLGGFSQGGMVACDIACRTSVPLAGLVLLSTAPVAEDTWVNGMKRRAKLRVFQSHGALDMVLPFEAGQRLRGLLEAAELEVEWHSFPGGHGVPPRVLQQLGKYLQQVAQERS